MLQEQMNNIQQAIDQHHQQQQHDLLQLQRNRNSRRNRGSSGNNSLTRPTQNWLPPAAQNQISPTNQYNQMPPITLSVSFSTVLIPPTVPYQPIAPIMS